MDLSILFAAPKAKTKGKESIEIDRDSPAISRWVAAINWLAIGKCVRIDSACEADRILADEVIRLRWRC